MEPLLVTAELVNGFCAADPWSPSLDGVLAYWVLYGQLGEEEFALGASGGIPPVVLGPDALPLAVERWRDLHWWQCSSPMYTAVTTHRRFAHRRFDQALAMRYADVGRSRVNVKAGPFKNYRIGLDIRICPRVQWHAIGDLSAVAQLLARCQSIGRGGAQGLGLVREWRVEQGGDAGLARFRRPLPEAFADEHGVTGVRMEWGIIPPGRLRQHRHLCVLPAPS